MMLLAEFAKLAHVQTQDERHVPLDLQQVDAFVFGEHYLIQMKRGKHYDVRDLDTILSVLHDEFELWKNQWVPQLRIRSSLPRAKQLDGRARMLVVNAVLKGSFLPALPVQHTVDTVRRAVTLYNLTGSWDQFKVGNL